MTRRTYGQIFLDKLAELASSAGKKSISNGQLRDALGWDRERYDRTKADLVEEGLISLGQGQGGTVIPGKKRSVRKKQPQQSSENELRSTKHSRGANASGVSIFISYSHSDEQTKTELTKHLEPLQQAGLISVWHDRKISAGDEWAQKIDRNLETADIILLLVSIDFVNSRYCREIELRKAMTRHEAKQAVVIPIILRDCIWSGSPFAKLQALPKDAKPVTSFSDLDSALTTVAKAIGSKAEELLARRR